jgi:SAM-dependent methyltransferase
VPEVDAWTWDPTLFAGAAAYYERGRIPYAPGLAYAMAEVLGLDGSGRLLDLGCGPGTLTLRLAHLFDEVVGLDPDPDMLGEAQRLADERKVSNARWILGRAEELPSDVGRFRAVTFGQSLHWMDQPVVFSAVRSLLAEPGVAVHVDTTARLPGSLGDDTTPYPPIPKRRMSELREITLGPDRRAGQGVRNTSQDGENEAFRAAGFVASEPVRVLDGRLLHRSIDDIVAETFSMSSTAPHLFGDQKPAFESELRALLLNASPASRFSVRPEDTLLKIWRPA